MLQSGNHVDNTLATSWNYRVMEFVTGDEGPWRSIHEVQPPVARSKDTLM